jgi:glycogen(starch) synthase
MRILMTADAVGGVWSYALELAGALRAHDVHVHLATMGPRPTTAQRAEASRLDNVTLHASDFRLEWMEEPWEDVARAGDWLLALERTLAPDLVHLNGYAHGALPWRAPVVVAAHSCVCSWWRAVRGTDAPPEWDRYRAAVTRGLSGAALVVAPTRAMLDAVAEHYGPVPARRVVPNGRTASAYLPGMKEPVVLAAGRVWDAAKNLETLVAAAPRSPWPVVIAGDDAPPAGAEGTTGLAAGAAERIRFLGRLPQRALATWFGRATIFALPARYEPFGLSALEAGLARCALVLGDIPSLREVWGDAPVYVDHASPRALGDALRALAGDPALMEEHAHRCRARALGYTPERMAIGYLDAYAAAAQEATCAS